jgi:acetyltransferase-like isoleucine patch superfamily enzyme
MFQKEYNFVLPRGYIDNNRTLHREGVMRIANADDEILPLSDPKVRQNPEYLTIIVLARVVSKLGSLPMINTEVIERLSEVDFAYLQNLYKMINSAKMPEHSRSEVEIMKTEKEKMLSGELYRVDDELTKERNQAQLLTFEYNQTSPIETDKRRKILEELLGSIGENVTIEAGFRCDYGKNISIGDNVFINFNFVALDCNKITIGNDVMIAPNVGIYTATHTVSPDIRKQLLEFAKPITICNGVWIGGGVSILPGVTIGENSVIGAGSVVTKDIPPNVVAYGNPCKVVKNINE